MQASQLVMAVRKSTSGVGNDALLTRAAAVAFYSALSFAPLIVLLLWVLAALRPKWQQQLTDGLARMLGEKAAGAIDLVVQNAKSTPKLGNPARVHRRVRRHVPPAAGCAHRLVGRLARRAADHGVVHRRQIRN